MVLFAILIISVLFIAVVIFAINMAPSIDKFKPKTVYRYEHIEPLLNTGDLIFMAGKTYSEKFVCWLSGCMFSHIGMIIREPDPVDGKDNVYIWDADIGQGVKRGPRIMLLKDKLARYKGHRKAAIIKLNSLRYISISDINKIVNEHISKDMDDGMYSYLTSDMPNSYINKITTSPNKIFCSELIADTYQKLALIKADKLPAYYTPKDFLDHQVPLQDGVKLSKPVFFIF